MKTDLTIEPLNMHRLPKAGQACGLNTQIPKHPNTQGSTKSQMGFGHGAGYLNLGFLWVFGCLGIWVFLFATPLRAQDANPNSATDLNSFDLITKRNIFNPNRTSHSTRKSDRPPARIDSFTLVGTMDYAKGWYAFFDGTSSEYRKSLKPGDLIAGYRVGQIAPDHITLLAASNKVIQLAVGTQMRRTDNGPWTLMKHAEPVTAPNPGEPADFTTKAANLNGAESDALKRLLLKRQNEK